MLPIAYIGDCVSQVILIFTIYDLEVLECFLLVGAFL